MKVYDDLRDLFRSAFEKGREVDPFDIDARETFDEWWEQHRDELAAILERIGLR